MAPDLRPLWHCPSCGRPFVTENAWHSCIVVSVDEHLARVPAAIGDIYRRFEAMVRDIGPITVAPVKTRIAFVGRMRFAGCRLQKGAVVAAFILRRRIDSPRFDRVERYGARSFGYYLKLRGRWTTSTRSSAGGSRRHTWSDNRRTRRSTRRIAPRSGDLAR